MFEFNSGRLCLDFANTVRARPLSDRVEYINKYDDLLEWSRQATILTPGEASALGQEAHRRSREAGEALAQGLALREAIHGLFSARAAGLPAPPADLRTLNQAIGRAMSHAGLTQSGGVRVELAGGSSRSRPRVVVGRALGGRASDVS